MTASNEEFGPRWIRPLPERLINKIAAGEVVERPASVVKEVVENALDAGAQQIDIAIEKSGMKLIRVADDGCGIGEGQIEVAFGRHATSKISDFKDLDRVTSYGFRGEALPSIASVSRMRMVSRPRDADHGMEIVFEGGVMNTCEPTGAAVGTTVEVSDLFYNVPARRKFLKTDTTEARHISRIVTAFAIGRPDIAFTYKLNGRNHFSLPAAQTVLERVSGLLRPDATFLKLRTVAGPVKIIGAIGRPDTAARNRYSQYLFINGRYVQAPSLAHALLAGYGDLMPRGNYPVGALLLEVDPAEVDVNVHPAKTEVRLSRERDIYEAIYRTVKEALYAEGVIPEFRMRSKRDGHLSGNAAKGSHGHVIPGVGGSVPANRDLLKELYRPETMPPEGDSAGVVQVDTRTGEILDKKPPIREISTSADSLGSVAPSAEQVGDGQATPGGLRLLGRFSDLYLVLHTGSALLIVDQHTAHERVLYEQTYHQLERDAVVAQRLLLPVEVELSPDQFALFEDCQELLNCSGFDISEFGGRMVRLEALPAVLSRRSPEKVIRRVLDDLADLRKAGYELRKAMAETIACRAAVKAGDRLTDREAEALVESLLKCENKFSCPHGRPTFIRLGRDDLDRQFGRG